MNYDNMTDEKLMELYQASDKSAFNTLFKRHSGLVYGYLLKKLKNEEVSKDVLQIVFMKLHVNKEKFNTEQPFLPWFFVLIKNTMTDELRKKKEHLELKEEMIMEDPEPQIHIDLDNAVRELNPRYQKVLEMRYTEDLDFEVIAKSLNTTPQNIRKIVSRAVSELKNKFLKDER
ncbi:MAG: sigma-70 family RNA polymerase sigma factor [Bdellovibrionota bacterium]